MAAYLTSKDRPLSWLSTFEDVHFSLFPVNLESFKNIIFRNSKWHGEISSRIVNQNRPRNNKRNRLECKMSNSVDSTKSPSKETQETKPFEENWLEANHDTTSSSVPIFQIFDSFGFRKDMNNFWPHSSSTWPLTILVNIWKSSRKKSRIEKNSCWYNLL